MKKQYGNSQVATCAECGAPAYHKNTAGITVCKQHLKSKQERKCVCGETLEARNGKYGTFYLCTNCGPLSTRKALGMTSKPVAKTEETIRSDDPRYFS